MMAADADGKREVCFRIDASEAGERLDKVLSLHVPDVSRTLLNRLIKEGVPGYVTQMAYEHYSRVPDFDIPTNVMVMVAKTGPFSIRKPEKLASDNAEIRKWRNKVGNVWIWTYPNKYGKLRVVGVPTMTDVPARIWSVASA